MNFFGIGALEIFVILLVALVALGPKRLPQAAQRLGVMLHQARRQAAEARQMFNIDADLNVPPTEPRPTESAERPASESPPQAGDEAAAPGADPSASGDER